MAKCRAHRVGFDEHITESIQWSRDDETGYYWRTTQEYIHNISEGTTKKNGKPVKSDNPYRLSTEEDHEYTMSYTGPDGKDAKLYFKEVTSD